MTPLAQIVHVFRNDLRRMQWPLIAFAAVLGVVAALGADNTPLLGSGAVPMAAVFAGMLLMALLVQDQSPSATDASWRVLPLSPAAVFAAKLLVLATVLVIGGVAEWLALVRFDVPAADAASLTAITLWPYLNWLLSAALVASFTRGIRGFVAALILTPIGLVIVGLLFEQITTTMGVSFDSTPAHYRWLSIAALVAAPWWSAVSTSACCHSGQPGCWPWEPASHCWWHWSAWDRRRRLRTTAMRYARARP
jgi:hypothetical protein